MVNPCVFCSAECCKTYTITTTIFDILRISSKTGKLPEDIAFLHEPRLLSYDPDMVLDTTDGYGYYLLGIRSHPCAVSARGTFQPKHIKNQANQRTPWLTI